MMESKKTILGKTENLPEDGVYDDQVVAWIKGFIGHDQDPFEPMRPLLSYCGTKY